MRILLHAPLHISFWIYLMESMPEHQWFIEPNDNFEGGTIPHNHIKYQVVPSEFNENFDVQIICLQLGSDKLRFLKLFPVPVVWLEYWRCAVPEIPIKYPLISTSYSDSNSEYPNIRYSHITPSPTLWNIDWIGDQPTVFISARRFSKLTVIAPILNQLKKKVTNLDVIEETPRTIPFEEWRNKFIHNRVLLDLSLKKGDMVLQEAMTIGMPVITFNKFDYPLVIRDKIDGFSSWNPENLKSEKELNELIELLNKFSIDYSFAKEWGERAKARAKECFPIEKQREIWNKAFEDAISLHQESLKKRKQDLEVKK